VQFFFPLWADQTVAIFNSKNELEVYLGVGVCHDIFLFVRCVLTYAKSDYELLAC
jgi:hypothetical protein